MAARTQSSSSPATPKPARRARVSKSRHYKVVVHGFGKVEYPTQLVLAKTQVDALAHVVTVGIATPDDFMTAGRERWPISEAGKGEAAPQNSNGRIDGTAETPEQLKGITDGVRRDVPRHPRQPLSHRSPRRARGRLRGRRRIDREPPEPDGECFQGGEAAAYEAQQQARIQRELKG